MQSCYKLNIQLNNEKYISPIKINVNVKNCTLKNCKFYQSLKTTFCLKKKVLKNPMKIALPNQFVRWPSVVKEITHCLKILLPNPNL